jgi:FkbM family methyltransferase
MFKTVRRKIKKELRKTFGIGVRSVDHIKYGLDPINDVNTLSLSLDKPINVVFDVGAHEGAASREYLKSFPSSHIFAFEPHKPAFEILRKNIQSSRFHPFELALTDKAADVKLYEYGDGSTISSLVPNARYPERMGMRPTEATVSATTLDLFCEQNKIDHISFLKIDTEGNDFSVVRGAERLLRGKHIDFIQFEFNDFTLKEGASGGSLNQLSDYISQFGFSFVATYTDYIQTKNGYFVVGNALAVRAG